MARMARSWLSKAKASMSSRAMSHFSAIISAPRNCDTSWVPYRSTQPVEPVNGSSWPRGWAASRAKPMGIMLMFCMPPATTRSCTPAMTPIAAKLTACWPEPHWRSTVVPGTASGRPAASQAVRAMSPACGPRLSTHPMTTSSTANGSTSLRSSTSLMTWAPRSAGWTSDRPPPLLPVGVRMASTM